MDDHTMATIANVSEGPPDQEGRGLHRIPGGVAKATTVSSTRRSGSAVPGPRCRSGGRGKKSPRLKQAGRTSAGKSSIKEAFDRELVEADMVWDTTNTALYGGGPGRVVAGQPYGDPDDRHPGGDDIDLDERGSLPPNLREGDGMNVCVTCVHFAHGGRAAPGHYGACMKYTWPVDRTDTCDDWETLSPPDAQLRWGIREAGLFDETKHPRGRGGKFKNILKQLQAITPGHSRNIGGRLITRGHGKTGDAHEGVFAVQRGPDLVTRGSVEHVAHHLAGTRARGGTETPAKRLSGEEFLDKILGPKGPRSPGSFGHDPELPGGYQDADLEMRQLEVEGNRRHAQVKKLVADHGLEDTATSRANVSGLISQHGYEGARARLAGGGLPDPPRSPGWGPGYAGELRAEAAKRNAAPRTQEQVRARKKATAKPRPKPGSKMSRRSGFDLLTETDRALALDGLTEAQLDYLSEQRELLEIGGAVDELLPVYVETLLDEAG
jgi:hypothetical protein